MQLTSFTDYGLRCLMYLSAQPERICSVREISEHYGVSRNHLVKVVHRLAQLGYVISSKGKGGGIMLAAPAESIRLGDVVRALEPNMHIVECFDKTSNGCTVVSGCNLRHYLHAASEGFIASLNDHSLADAVKSKRSFMP